jgi:hypothetical protein
MVSPKGVMLQVDFPALQLQIVTVLSMKLRKSKGQPVRR